MNGPINEVAELAREIRIAQWVALTGAGPRDPETVDQVNAAVAEHIIACGWRRP